MADRFEWFARLRHLWRRLILISLIVSSCQSAPAQVVTPTTVDITDTAASGLNTSIVPSQTSPPVCTPHPILLPTQPPAAAPTRISVTADGLVQSRILPSPYLIPTYVRAPIAWTRSTGKGITVAVARNHDEDLSLLNLIAPDVQVQALSVDGQMTVAGTPLLDVLKQKNVRLLAILEPADFDPQALRNTASALNGEGIAIFVNGDLRDGSEERDLVNSLEAGGTITVGRLKYGMRIQGRDLYHRQINLFAGYGGDSSTFDHGAVLTVAGVGALVLAAQPTLEPGALKQHLIATADQMYTGINPITNKSNIDARVIDPQTGDFSPTDSAFQFRRVNAASAVGLRLAERWPLNAMNLPAAWKIVTGRGVTVGVIDASFYPNDPILKDHIVDLFPKEYFSGDTWFHGHVVAKAVIAVAPDASLMLLHDSDDSDLVLRAQRTALAIDYAVQHGARVLTNSGKSWINTPEVHAAIDRAIAAGVVLVTNDYTGPNPAVIRAGDWRSPAWEVGTFTFFLDNDRPSESEGGISFAPPQIAAIAALILQNEPSLTPIQVKQRILETATVLPNGGSLADAVAAVENGPSGRQLEGQQTPASPDGSLHLTYQASEDTPVTIEIEEHHQNWPIPSRARQDLLAYRIVPFTRPPMNLETSTVQLVAYRNFNQVLTIEWTAKDWISGDQPAKLTLLPDGEWQPSYSVQLGTEGVPPLHVEVICDRVRLTWNSNEGIPLERGEPQFTTTTPSDMRLLSLEIEAPLMPDLVEPSY